MFEIGELVYFLKEELDALAVLDLSVGEVQRLQSLAPHEHELEHFALEVRDVEASELEHLDPALVVDERLAHVEEALGVEEIGVRDVEFLELPRIIQKLADGPTVELLVEQHLDDAHLPNFGRELQTLHYLLEVSDWRLKSYFLYVKDLYYWLSAQK